MEAIIEVGGKQFRVSEGSTIEVFRPAGAEVGKTVEMHPVACIDGNELISERNALRMITVRCAVEAEKKGKKVYVFRKTAKTGYRRGIGHRDRLVVLRVEKLTDNRT